MLARLRRLRQTNVFLLLATAYTVCLQLMVYIMYHPVLPFYLRDIFTRNCSDPCSNSTEIEAEISQTIGVITGTGSAVQLAGSFFVAILVQKLAIRTNLLIGILISMTSPLVALFANDVVTMCVANSAISLGFVSTLTTFYTLYSRRSRDDRELTRLVGSYSIFNGLGIAIGYSAASASYQFFGHKVTFGTLFGLSVLDVFFRMSLPTTPRLKRQTEPTAPNEDILTPHDVDTPLHDHEMNETTEERNRTNVGAIAKWRIFLSDPYIFILSAHCVLTYITTCIVWGTAPNFVATQLHAQQWQTGAMMGVGAAADLAIQLTATLLVTTHRRRCSTMFVCFLLYGCGLLWYPFIQTVWEGLGPEIILRSTKNVNIILVTTLYSFITDRRNVGDYKMGYALLSISISTGAMIGYYLSGVLVVSMTFKWLYIAMGVTMATVSLTVLPFAKFKVAKSNMALKENESIMASLTLVNRSTLGLAELTSSTLSVNNVMKRSRSNLTVDNSVHETI